MRTIFGKRSAMNGVSSLSKSAASALVDREYRASGSKMIAYDRVGQMVGVSGDWVRGFVKGYGAKVPDIVVGFNILATFKSVYGMTCEAIERKAAEERKLKDDIDAALECAGLIVERDTPKKSVAEET